jgi:AcrR family transcriptional regulator
VTFDGESTQTSRRRLFEAGKHLFAQLGYEQASTAAIAREAGTSESQLVRYYHGKSGLLEAIFEESWLALNQAIQQVVMVAANAREAMAGVLEAVTQAFKSDPDLAYLLLFEGRRVRAGSSEIVLSKGFREFEHLLCLLIGRGKRDGTFGEAFNDKAVASALLGATEAMIRDRMLAQRGGQPVPFTDEEVRGVFASVLRGFSQ